MEDDIFNEFCWHSCIGIDEALSGNKKFVTRLKNTKKARMMFDIHASDSTLVHKSTKALWRISDDKKFIEPVFGSDILTEDELNKMESD